MHTIGPWKATDAAGRQARYEGVSATPAKLPGPEDFMVIQPGQVCRRMNSLPFDFTKAGIYAVSVSTAAGQEDLKFFYGKDSPKLADNPDHVWTGRLTSNTVEVVIAPPATQAERTPWGQPGTAGLQIRMVILDQAERKKTRPIWADARLELRNTGPQPIKLARMNVDERKRFGVAWVIGLYIDVLLPDGRTRRFSPVEKCEQSFWSEVYEPDDGPVRTDSETIEPAKPIGLIINLHQLVDKEGAERSSVEGRCQLRPVLEVKDGKGRYWSGSATGHWVSVQIEKAVGNPDDPARQIFAPATQPDDSPAPPATQPEAG